MGGLVRGCFGFWVIVLEGGVFFSLDVRVKPGEGRGGEVVRPWRF